MKKLILSVALIIVTSACVPIINTYYAPSSGNGSLTSSGSCGPNDSIIIKESGVKVKLYIAGNTAFVRVLPESRDVRIDFSKVFVVVRDGSVFQPAKVTRGEYGTSSQNIVSSFIQTLRPKNRYFFELHFDIQNMPDQFSIEINQVRTGQSIFNFPAVDFNKTSKPGIGYVNC